MAKMILAFLLVFGLFFALIGNLWYMKNGVRLELLKWVGYSLLCSILTIGFFTVFVILF